MLTPLDQIVVPPARADQLYQGDFLGETFQFCGLKALLGAADHPKAGDRHSGLAAKDEVEREVARLVLSNLSLQHLYDHPLTTQDGRIDQIVRVSYDIDTIGFAGISSWTVGQLKDQLLAHPRQAAGIGWALTAVMAAALAKVCDVHELIAISRAISRPTTARTSLGAPGTLSSRLQPNHPTDDPRGIELLVYTGLTMGQGDAMIGLNPANDTVETISALLRQLDQLRRETGAPTQICVLGHIRTQLACLEAGAPVEILFQSLAGTERCNREEFDIDVALLDRGYEIMRERGVLGTRALGAAAAPQFCYFETGQGSELTYGKHEGLDMTTAEALCYTLARRYDPFMVNNVTGFIGPETHLDDREMIVSNLQDHFMGKLLGLPMGMAPCYTLHANITLEGQQMATELLTAAGANFYMDVHLNTDRMLAYFDTSGHDDQTLRETYGRQPSAQFAKWGIEKGIFAREAGQIVRGPRWGDPTLFAAPAHLAALAEATPTYFGATHTGSRPPNAVSRQVRLHQAWARRATYAPLDVDRLALCGPFRILHTLASTRASHLANPAAGATLSPESLASLAPEPHRVQVLVADGLSAAAVNVNIPALLPPLVEGLGTYGNSIGQPLLAHFGRVKLAEPVADALGAEMVVVLIGERPGGDASAATSLSAYLAFRVAPGRFEYSVLSNIYEGGVPPAEAAVQLVHRIMLILEHQAAGNRLESLVNA